MGLSKGRKSQRVKWYQCFRPEKRFSDDRYPYGPVPFYENGGGKENINRDLAMRNAIIVALSDDENGSFAGSVPVSDDHRCRRSKSRRGFSRAIKAVMSPIVSVRKSRSKKFDQEKPQFRSNSSSMSSRIEKMFQSFGSKNSSAASAAAISKENPLSDSHRTDSSAGSLFSNTTAAAASSAASSRASSLASNSRSESARKKSISVDLKQLEKKQNPAAFHGGAGRRCNAGGCCKTMLGLYFLFVCLLALALCGKALAVFCTSSSLFLLPCCLKKIAGAGDHLRRWCPFVYSSVDPVDCVVVDCDKKLVGMLETQRSRNGRLQ